MRLVVLFCIPIAKIKRELFLCRILWFADRLWLPINRETLHPLKRSILCNAPCSETPNQRMRRFRGFGVSRLIGISRSICKSEDTANGRMRQMTRSGSFHGHHIRECGVWEDRVSFHDQSANHMMRQFAWSGISREIDKWQDGAISRHCRASRKCCSHICYFSKFLAELFDMFFVFSYSLLIGQVFAFCNFIFRVYDTVCDWSKTLI